MWMDREIQKNTELRLFAEKIESFYAIQLRARDGQGYKCRVIYATA